MDFETFKDLIKDLDSTYRLEKGRDDLRKFYLQILSLASQLENRPKYLWVGLSEDGVFTESLSVPDYKKLHVQYKTDSNLLLGDFVFNKQNNTFFPSIEANFFVDSWNGHFYGKFNPFKILQDSLYQKAS